MRLSECTDLTGLYAAILRDPEDDTVRLAYADALDEAGEDPARAEFIRVQVELARIADTCRCGACVQRGSQHHNGKCDANRFRRRSAVLLNENSARWLRVPCVECGGIGRETIGRKTYHGRCLDCRGTGDAGGLTWEFNYPREVRVSPNATVTGYYPTEPARVHWSRGFPHRVEVPRMGDCVEDCPRCGGDGISHGSDRPFEGAPGPCQVCKGNRKVPSQGLTAVVTHHPTVQEVVPLDRVPRSNAVTGDYSWVNTSPGMEYWDNATQLIPAPLWQLLDGYSTAPDARVLARRYSTREAAASTLGRAVVAFGRSTLTGENHGEAQASVPRQAVVEAD